ncbi:hypothetical protein EPN44_05830 [bacterium]|nr:MAG: hypothetical protein EPN44_05830 [bacterium]
MSAPGGNRGALGHEVEIPIFAIADLRGINRGALVASLTVEIPGVGRIDGVLFENERGRVVRPAAVRNMRGEYTRTVQFEPAFADAVRDAVEHLLAEGKAVQGAG